MVKAVVCCDLCLDRQVDGAVNFRDLGGYATRTGRVRRGLIFRAGMTHFISDAGWRTLRSAYGVRTVIDLRTPAELRDGALPRFDAYGIAHHHAPVFAETGIAATEELKQRFAEMRSGRYDWPASYVRMLEQGGPAFRRVFNVIAAADALPAVFHCTGGRDRTGVAAALLLSVLGVADADIARDYALSGVHLRRQVDRFARPAARMTIGRDEMEQLLETREEAMVRFLTLARDRYGSAEGYLAGIGVTEETLATVRDRLIETA